MIERFNESFEFRMNTLYIAAQGLYWMLVCCCVSMGSAYLANRGYSTFGIGFLFAIAYLIAAVIQQIVSVKTDNSTNFDVLDVLFILGAIVSIDLLLSVCTKGKGFATDITFLICATVTTIIQPFLNALNFHIAKYGVKMNFGVARASGSFFFFIMSLIAGFLMKVASEKAAHVLGLIVAVFFTALILYIYRNLKESGKVVSKDYDPFQSRPDDFFDAKYLKQFFEKYKMFFYFSTYYFVGFFF